MELEKFAQDVKDSFINVESEAFLNKKVGIEKEKIAADYERLKSLYPTTKSYIASKRAEINIHTTNNEEKMAIGIHLLALEDFEKQMT